MQEKERIEWVDNTKAFACFLVVLGHLLQSLIKAGIDYNSNITSTISSVIYVFHMPLFMFLSGYLYCLKNNEFNIKQYFQFVGKKTINLLIPYLVFYILYFFLNVAFASSVNTPKTIDDLIGIINDPMPPYWFLYALISIFTIIPIIEKICQKNEKFILLTVSLLKIISIFFKTNIYFIDIFASYSIYFYLGVFCKTIKIQSKVFCIISLLVYYTSVTLIIINAGYINQIGMEFIRVVLAIVGVVLHVNAFKFIKKTYILDTFKKYTFQIFLMHTIFAAAIRILLIKLGVQNYMLHLIIGIAASIYIPVIISIIAEKTKALEFVFYPIKTIKSIKLAKKENN